MVTSVVSLCRDDSEVQFSIPILWEQLLHAVLCVFTGAVARKEGCAAELRPSSPCSFSHSQRVTGGYQVMDPSQPWRKGSRAFWAGSKLILVCPHAATDPF